MDLTKNLEVSSASVVEIKEIVFPIPIPEISRNANTKVFSMIENKAIRSQHTFKPRINEPIDLSSLIGEVDNSLSLSIGTNESLAIKDKMPVSSQPKSFNYKGNLQHRKLI